MKAIALTGCLGSGKTTVLKFVRNSRIATISCDPIVSKLYKEKKVKAKLLKLFGTHNKKKIAEIVFASPKKRKQLESLLHPLVWKRVSQKLAAFRKQGRKLAIVEVPLLFEANWQARFSSAIFVKSPKKKCMQRLLRKGMARKDFLQRWNSQLSQGKKIKRTSHVIDNSSSLRKTEKQARQLLLSLRRG